MQGVCDIDDLSKKTLLDRHLSPTAENLSETLVTSAGDNLFDLLLFAIKDAIEFEYDLEIKAF